MIGESIRQQYLMVRHMKSRANAKRNIRACWPPLSLPLDWAGRAILPLPDPGRDLRSHKRMNLMRHTDLNPAFNSSGFMDRLSGLDPTANGGLSRRSEGALT